MLNPYHARPRFIFIILNRVQSKRKVTDYAEIFKRLHKLKNLTTVGGLECPLPDMTTIYRFNKSLSLSNISAFVRGIGINRTFRISTDFLSCELVSCQPGHGVIKVLTPQCQTRVGVAVRKKNISNVCVSFK